MTVLEKVRAMARFRPFWALVAAGLAGCGGETTTAAPAPPSAIEAQEVDPSATFLEMTAGHAALLLRAAPELATSLGVDEATAGEGYASRLSGYGPNAHAGLRRMNEDFLKALRATPRDQLSGTSAATYDVLKNAYELAARRNAFSFGGAAAAGGFSPQVGSSWAISPYFVTQLTGPHLALPRMMQTQHRLETEADADAYLARLEAFGPAFDGVIETLAADADAGVVPPYFAIEGAIASARGFVEPAPEAHPLVTTFAENLADIDALGGGSFIYYRARATRLVESVVYPAYGRLADALEALLPQAGSQAGVWRLGEQGTDFYQMALNAYGAGGRSGDEVHAIGRAEVARITGEMDAILKSLGFDDGSIGERMALLAERDDMIYPNTDEGREALLASLRAMIAEIMALAPDWFETLPPQTVEVRRIPVYEEDSSPAGYYSSSSLDGSRPGIYWINLKDTADNPKLGLKTLTYHEAVPGHHFQYSSQRAIKDMPLMRNLLNYSPYAEGWALYAEELAVEMGLYEDDPLGDLGRLQAEIFRAARLVVDTGLHHKRWTREEAIDYMVETTGETRAAMTREVERYAAVPGQACAYKLGMLRIKEMRARAEEALGEAFDIRAFHDEILSSGSMPLDVLDARIDRWIEAEGG